jgi:DNA-binding transcriptional MerR regulator
MHIGEVADSVGLPLRTIRLYDEAGVVSPSQRSDDGSGLYSDADVDRLRFVKRLRPLDLSLEEVSEVVDALDELGEDGTPAERRRELVEQLAHVAARGEERATQLREQLAVVESVTGELRDAVLRGRRPAASH